MWRQLNQRWTHNKAAAHRAALITILLGLVLWRLPQTQALVHLSFDLPTRLAPAQTPPEVLIIHIDEPSLTELNQPYNQFNRTNHANLLKQLTAAPARLVVFDMLFSEPRPEDAEFAEAIRANGRVVLAADYAPMPGYIAGSTSLPVESLRSAASNRWGISRVYRDADLTLRLHYPERPERHPSLPWVAAQAVGASIANMPQARFSERWLRYYATNGTLPGMSYYLALLQSPEFFKDKIVFVGGKPATRNLFEEVEEFGTPFTAGGGPLLSGIEVQATTFLNLLRNEWLDRTPAWAECLLLVLGGLVLAYGFSLVRPALGAGLGLGALLALTFVGCWSFSFARFWFPWALIAGAQIPCAWLCAAVWQVRKLCAEKQELETQLVSGQMNSIPGAGVPTPLAPGPAVSVRPSGGSGEVSPGGRPQPLIAEYTLLRRIGKGAYGEVFLARNAIGLYHAIKVVYRDNFAEAHPYEREFNGIRKYMPISLNHPGLTPVLHVGRNDERGYFYYVMELGDDHALGAVIKPEIYAPRNLSEEIKQRGWLSVAQCLEWFVPLLEALEFLHQANLVHRDIKPSNIIFAKGVPKLADIGLVTEAAAKDRDVSYVGTAGYIAPEGPGTPAADLYSLGIVLYEAATGMSHKVFPELPKELLQSPEISAYMQLNRMILKACQKNPQRRYACAAEMRLDCLRLRKQIAKSQTA